MIDCEFVKELRDALAGPYRDKHVKHYLWKDGGFNALGVAYALRGIDSWEKRATPEGRRICTSVDEALDENTPIPRLYRICQVNDAYDSFEGVIWYLEKLIDFFCRTKNQRSTHAC